jgi:phosphoserine phosphatase RsbU/P
MSRLSRLTLSSGTGSLQALLSEQPARALLPLLIAIFALFALLGPLVDIQTGGRLPMAVMLRNTVLSGLFAVGYALGPLRRNWWLFGATAVAQVLWVLSQSGGTDRAVAQGANLPRLKVDAVLAIGLMIVSYTFFLRFINGTAARYQRVRAEIELAHEIHQVLVPSIATRIGEFEFAGFSRPSGEVGGDLVDVVTLDDGWFGYVADVSGHGVSSGVVMGMFKSALRMRLRQGGPIASLLDDLNDVLHPLKSSAMFVTAACVRGRDDGTLDYAVAGHLPILRVRAGGGVDEITTPQVPVGMFEHYTFASASVACARGEMLVLVTDGLTEVFDAADRELGIGAVKALLSSSNGRPLREIADAIVAQARAHGTQIDDQTLLLIRRA